MSENALPHENLPFSSSCNGGEAWQVILVLIEQVAAKDIPPRKRRPNGGYAPSRIPAFPVVRRLERFNKISEADFQ
jgi:hypothetical protein